MTGSERGGDTIGRVIGVLQLLTLVVGIGAVMLQVGRRDAILSVNVSAIEKLREITQRLSEVTASNSARGIAQERELDDLGARLRTLEADSRRP